MADSGADEQLWQLNLHLEKEIDQYFNSRDKVSPTTERSLDASNGPDTSKTPPSTPRPAQGLHFLLVY
jgi:hypothetical protein